MDGKAASQENELDLTNFHLSNLDDVDLPQSLTVSFAKFSGLFALKDVVLII